jgi:hypothetical protein
MPPEPGPDGDAPSRGSNRHGTDGDDSPDVADTTEITVRARERIDHACATIDCVLDHCESVADDAALRRARRTLQNARGDLDELAAIAEESFHRG